MMIKLYPEDLQVQLSKKLSTVYFLIGDDPFFLRESYDKIRQTASTYGFKEHHTFQIDNSTNWQAIFSLCNTMSFFSTRQTIQLLLPEKNFDIDINKKFKTLVSLLHDDILLIVRSNQLTKSQKSSSWFYSLSTRSVQISCFTPKKENLPEWTISRAKKHSLQLDDDACQVLCDSYEGNLLALSQAIEKLSLLWPASKITLSHVLQIANDGSHFSPIHWIDSLLIADSKRALHILQQLRFEGIEPVILLRMLQRELFLLLKLQRESVKISLSILFNKYLVWKNRRLTIKKTLNRLTEREMRHAIYLLTRIELIIKEENCFQLVWNELESLSLLLCNNTLSDVFVYG